MTALRRRHAAVLLVLLVAAACGDGGKGTDRVLTAAGSAGEEAPTAPPVPPSTSPPPTAPATTVTTRRPAPTTTAAATTRTTRPAVAPSYSPAPPPPGVQPDGYGGYGGVTSTSAGGVSIKLSVYPRDQYFGGTMQVWVEVAHPVDVAVTAIKIDFGNGHAVTATPLPRWNCGSPDNAPASAWYTYPAPGRFRITATATAAPCHELIPGVPGQWVGPIGAGPPGVPSREWSVSAGMDILQRSDGPPPPVGPPPGP